MSQTNPKKRPHDGDFAWVIKKRPTPRQVAEVMSASTESASAKIGRLTPDRVEKDWVPTSMAGRNKRSKAAGTRPTTEFLWNRMETIRLERLKLPIWQNSRRVDLKYDLRYKTDIIILVGETGSGKSTQVPQFLMDEPYNLRRKIKVIEDGIEKEVFIGGAVAVTEPRRVAVTSLAYRVAAETGSHLQAGKKHGMTQRDRVGYSIRFEHVQAPGQKIKFITEGMLLQEMRTDPWLRKYGAVIIDEIHERSVDVDILAGLVKQILWSDLSGRGGAPLKVIIMSATAQVDKVKSFFETPPAKGSLGKYAASSTDILPQGNTPATEDPEARRKSDSSTSEFAGFSPLRDGETAEKISVTDIVDQLTTETAETTSATDNVDQCPAKTNGQGSADAEKLAETEVNLAPTSKLVTPPKKINAELHIVEGRQHNVNTFYMPEPAGGEFTEAMGYMIMRIHQHEPGGDILCFLPGRDDIDRLYFRLKSCITQFEADPTNKKKYPALKIHTLYGQQTMDEQTKVLKPGKVNTRKVILATNVAETSVTVPGVKYVVDSGLAKIKHFHPEVHLESLLRREISQSAANQRKGRAGRQSEGKCYRLFTEANFEGRDYHDVPEIMRSNIASAILRMKVFGIDNPLDFEWLDRPDDAAMANALSALVTLEAIDKDGKLTEMGKMLEKFPLSVEYARAIVAASEAEEKCTVEVIDIIAGLTCGEDVFIHSKDEEEEQKFIEKRQKFQSRAGDTMTLLNVMRQYMAVEDNHFDWCKANTINPANMKVAMSIRKDLLKLCGQLELLKKQPPALPHTYSRPTEKRTESILYVRNLPWMTYKDDEEAKSLGKCIEPAWFGSPADQWNHAYWKPKTSGLLHA